MPGNGVCGQEIESIALCLLTGRSTVVAYVDVVYEDFQDAGNFFSAFSVPHYQWDKFGDGIFCVGQEGDQKPLRSETGIFNGKFLRGQDIVVFDSMVYAVPGDAGGDVCCN